MATILAEKIQELLKDLKSTFSIPIRAMLYQLSTQETRVAELI